MRFSDENLKFLIQLSLCNLTIFLDSKVQNFEIIRYRFI
jgi:hypothetical protein